MQDTLWFVTMRLVLFPTRFGVSRCLSLICFDFACAQCSFQPASLSHDACTWSCFLPALVPAGRATAAPTRKSYGAAPDRGDFVPPRRRPRRNRLPGCGVWDTRCSVAVLFSRHLGLARTRFNFSLSSRLGLGRNRFSLSLCLRLVSFPTRFAFSRFTMLALGPVSNPLWLLTLLALGPCCD